MSNGNRGLVGAFVVANLFAAGWAAVLVDAHAKAKAALLEPGLLCGPDGGCGAVLASEYATILGVPVSLPAIPMFAMLAILGIAAMAGKLHLDRLAGLATFCGLVGLGFGGWLLFHMLVTLDAVCRYCLVMDAANLVVLVLAMLVHTGGMAGAWRELTGTFSGFAEPGPELLVTGSVLLGVGGWIALGPTEEASAETVVDVQIEEVSPQPAPTKKATSKKAKKDPTSKRVVIPAKPTELELDKSIPWKGPKNAAVEIVLFEDFQCPFCKTLTGNIEALLERRDDVRIGFVHFPMHSACNETPLKKDMHKYACNAAAAAVCAQDQGRFWEMHDALFRYNPHLKSKQLVDYADEIGLDTGRFKACMSRKSTLAKIRNDTKIGGEAGVSGTPTFFVNGRRLSGGQPVEVLEAVIDALKAQTAPERLLLDVDLEGELIGEVSDAPSVQFEGFAIDAFEASVSDGAAVSVAGVEPARGLNWYEADAACKAAGKRLCTEREWLLACTGAEPVDADGDGVFSDDRTLGRPYPYGMFQQKNWCASHRAGKDDPTPLITGNHPKCATPEGVYDLEGLTKEWVGTTPSKAGLKGGSYYSRQSARCGYFKDSQAPDTTDPSIGFRCCSGALEDVDDGALAGGRVGDSIRAWSGTTADGKTLSHADLAGKPYIMTFWASWCGPCRKELPALAALYESYKAQGLTVVAVNVDRSPPAAKRFLKANPLPYPVVMDHDMGLMNQFDTRGVPTTFWVTKSGTIRQRTVGYDDREKDTFDGYVQTLLSK